MGVGPLGGLFRALALAVLYRHAFPPVIFVFSIPAPARPVMAKPGGHQEQGCRLQRFFVALQWLYMVRSGSRLGRENTMKSFWIGSIAAVIIAIVAGVVLSGSGMTTGERYSSANTRL